MFAPSITYGFTVDEYYQHTMRPEEFLELFEEEQRKFEKSVRGMFPNQCVEPSAMLPTIPQFIKGTTMEPLLSTALYENISSHASETVSASPSVEEDQREPHPS